MTESRSLNRWPVTGWLALIDLAIVAVVWSVVGSTQDGVHTLVLLTARISLVLFLAAFAASSLRAIWPNKATTWLLRNRRYVGVGFAFAHFAHLGTLVMLYKLHPAKWAELVSIPLIVFGSIGYVFIALMTATSFDRTTRFLGAKRWKRLHLTGGYYIWLLFALTYIPRAFNNIVFVPAALLVILALGLRIGRRSRKRRKTASVASPG